MSDNLGHFLIAFSLLCCEIPLDFSVVDSMPLALITCLLSLTCLFFFQSASKDCKITACFLSDFLPYPQCAFPQQIGALSFDAILFLIMLEATVSNLMSQLFLVLRVKFERHCTETKYIPAASIIINKYFCDQQN